MRIVAEPSVNTGCFTVVFADIRFGRVINRIDGNRSGNAGINSQTGRKYIRKNAALRIGFDNQIFRRIDNRVGDFGQSVISDPRHQNRGAGTVVKTDSAGTQRYRKIFLAAVVIQAFAQPRDIPGFDPRIAKSGYIGTVDQGMVVIIDFRNIHVAGNTDFSARAADHNRIKISFGIGCHRNVIFRFDRGGVDFGNGVFFDQSGYRRQTDPYRTADAERTGMGFHPGAVRCGDRNPLSVIITIIPTAA